MMFSKTDGRLKVKQNFDRKFFEVLEVKTKIALFTDVLCFDWKVASKTLLKELEAIL